MDLHRFVPTITNRCEDKEATDAYLVPESDRLLPDPEAELRANAAGQVRGPVGYSSQ